MEAPKLPWPSLSRSFQNGDGADRVVGGTGNDDLTGGAAADTFAFSFGDGFDTVADFEIGTDLIDLLGLGLGFFDLTITDNRFDGNRGRSRNLFHFVPT